MNIIRLFGVLTVIVILAFIVYNVRRDSSRKRARMREALMS